MGNTLPIACAAAPHSTALTVLGRQAVGDGLRLHAVLQAGLAAAALALLHLSGCKRWVRRDSAL